MSEGGVFVQNSTNNCVYHERHKYKMSTSLHAVFNLIFDNVYFVIVISSIRGPKMQFSESSQNFLPEKSSFGHFEVIFLNV